MRNVANRRTEISLELGRIDNQRIEMGFIRGAKTRLKRDRKVKGHKVP